MTKQATKQRDGLTYKEYLTQLNAEYAQDPLVRYIGYNTRNGSRMYGTLSKVRKGQCIEMPVSENLMMGMAVGLALAGYKPVVCFERHDFIPIALDALANHADRLGWISGEQFTLPILVRAITGASGPLDAGWQHTSNYKKTLRDACKFTDVIEPINQRLFERAYNLVGKTISGTVVVIEHRDWFDRIMPEQPDKVIV